MNKNLEYWTSPHGNNIEALYFKDGNGKTDFLVNLIKKYSTPKDSILEIGCNVGRNLSALYNSGFKNITGIEINPTAITLGEQKYPEIKGKMILTSIEDKIKDLKPFDVVYTMAVLEHITPESDWIFPEIKRITGKYLITIEDEHNASWKHFPRNYKKVFEGLEQVEEVNLEDNFKAEFNGFVLRVFKKNEKISKV